MIFWLLGRFGEAIWCIGVLRWQKLGEIQWVLKIITWGSSRIRILLGVRLMKLHIPQRLLLVFDINIWPTIRHHVLKRFPSLLLWVRLIVKWTCCLIFRIVKLIIRFLSRFFLNHFYVQIDGWVKYWVVIVYHIYVIWRLTGMSRMINWFSDWMSLRKLLNSSFNNFLFLRIW